MDPTLGHLIPVHILTLCFLQKYQVQVPVWYFITWWSKLVWRRGRIPPPSCCARRRKGKSQIWDSKILSQVPRDSDPIKTALARASSIYKRQTRLLVREGAPQKQDRKCQTVMGLDTKTYWLTDRQSQCDFDFEESEVRRMRIERVQRSKTK
jgi:hypothetical protein